MSESMIDESVSHRDDITRRDFLYVSTGAVAGVGTFAAVWPIIDSMNPAADVVALASVEIDLTALEVGQRITVTWRGQPVFIDHRTHEQIVRARQDDDADLKDPALDSERATRPEWLIVVGICTHLGCVPMGQRAGTSRGKWGGWFCPCHGSHYDASGRIRQGPAPRNLLVPPYEHLDDTHIRIG